MKIGTIFMESGKTFLIDPDSKTVPKFFMVLVEEEKFVLFTAYATEGFIQNQNDRFLSPSNVEEIFAKSMMSTKDQLKKEPNKNTVKQVTWKEALEYGMCVDNVDPVLLIRVKELCERNDAKVR